MFDSDAPNYEVDNVNNKISFADLQEQQKTWVKYNFPNRTDEHPFLGIMEELGELAHSRLKQKQGIRGSFKEHEEKQKDAIGDMVIFIADFCTSKNWNFQEIVEKTWDEVKKRDWIKYPKNGRNE